MDVNGFRFETKPATESVALYQDFLGAGVFDATETPERVMLHRIAADAVEDQNEETKQKIKDEIDAAPMSAEREEQEKKQQMQQFQASFMTDKANLKGEGAALAA